MKNDKRNEVSVLDWLIVLLFFGGVALIAAGLWQFGRPLALVFLGIACLYVATCVSKTANPHERTDKK